MKKIYVIILVLPFLFAACKKTGGDPGSERYVLAQRGLVLRAESSRTGRSLGLIPFKAKVTVLDISGPAEEIDGIRGNWYRVRWNGLDGWVFGGYVKPVVAGGNDYLLYNVLIDNVEISHNTLKPGKEDSSGRIPFDPGFFHDVPDIFLNDELVVIDDGGIFTDSIGKLYLESNIDSLYVSFDLKSGRKVVHPVYIRKRFYETISSSLPVMEKMKAVNDPALVRFFYSEIAGRDSIIMEMPGSTQSMKKDDIIRDRFTLEMLDISGGGVKTYVAATRNRRAEDECYTCAAVISDGVMVFARNGVLLNSFSINGNPYLLFEVWTPHTGETGRVLMVNNRGRIETVAEDFGFSN